MVTKVVPMRAVNISIGAFCTEFRCEQLCDDGIFRSGPGDRAWGKQIGLKKSMRSGSNPAAPGYKFSPVRLGARFQHVCSVRAWVARRCGQPRLGYHPGNDFSPVMIFLPVTRLEFPGKTCLLYTSPSPRD